jgi:hypothetical protein
VSQKPGNAVRNDARLAAAWAREDQQRSVNVRDSVALSVGEVFEKSVQRSCSV